MTSSRSSASITSRVRIPLSRCAQGKGSAAPHCRLTGGHPTVVDGPVARRLRGRFRSDRGHSRGAATMKVGLSSPMDALTVPAP
jgi:hypothetical protein